MDKQTPIKDRKLPFGKYKDEKISFIVGIDLPYIQWYYTKFNHKLSPSINESIRCLAGIKG